MSSHKHLRRFTTCIVLTTTDPTPNRIFEVRLPARAEILAVTIRPEQMAPQVWAIVHHQEPLEDVRFIVVDDGGIVEAGWKFVCQYQDGHKTRTVFLP